VEIGDWSRLTGSSIGAYVGLVPSEHSSGGSRVQGSITKAGNTHVRRLLIESVCHHRKSYSTSGPTQRARWAKVDPALRARGHAGNRRLNKTPAELHRTRQEPERGQRRHRPRTGRLVVVSGHPAVGPRPELDWVRLIKQRRSE